MAEVLVDTDVFVDHLRGASPLRAGSDSLFYSTITRAELFAGPSDHEVAVRSLLAPFAEIGVDRAVAELAGRVRRATGVLLPDALIAATALRSGLELLTGNSKDFARVEGLRLRRR